MVLLLALLWVLPDPCFAEEKEKVYKVDDIQVTAEREDEEGIKVTPTSKTINVEAYEQPGTPQTIVDLLRDSAIIDFRGSSDLTRENDNIYMRGFDSRNFVTAMDGLSVEKSGGYRGGHFVDFSTIPFNQIESIEIIAGPHSALYSGRAIGGVLNVKTKAPKRYESVKPNVDVMTSYKSYNTQTHRINIDGGVDAFVYGFSYEKYHTDGFLRHNETDTETVSGRIGYILPSDGYISFSTSYQEAVRESAINNDPEGRYADYYDSDYPVSESGGSPTNPSRREKDPYSYRFNYKQPTPIGDWTIGAYYTKENQRYVYESTGVVSKATDWNSFGGNIKNDVRLFDTHLVTVGVDYQQLRNMWQKIDESYGVYLQDKWTIVPRLTFTGGLRYEDIKIWWNNLSNYTEGEYVDPTQPEDYIKRGYDQLIPKSFLTYELDDIASGLRDTSVSVGVSKIWTPKSYCQVCSWGSGIELDPMHGMGYDLIFMRRLWNDIIFKIDYSYYQLKDYVISASDRDYINETEWGRRRLNLEEVIKQGVEVELNGHLFGPLSFYVSYAFTDWEYNGPNETPYGDAAESLDDRAKNRLSAGLRYQLFDGTLLLLDYKFQEEQIQLVCEEEPEDSNNWVCYENAMDEYHVFDFAVEQTLFRDKWGFKDVMLKVYVNNLFNTYYENSRGYPMTDRTIGAALNFKF